MSIILIDLDNTLFDRTAVFRSWAEHFATDQDLGPEAVEWMVEADDDGFADRHELWERAVDRFGLDESLDRLVTNQRTGYLDLLTPDPAMLDSLITLRAAGYCICVVTNGPMPHQLEKAQRLGIVPHLSGFVASGELGVAKPDRKIFEEAMRRAAGPSDSDGRDSWMIGDSPSADVAGARAMGLRTVWIHREREWDLVHGAPPDFRVKSVPDAVTLILSHGQ